MCHSIQVQDGSEGTGRVNWNELGKSEQAGPSSVAFGQVCKGWGNLTEGRTRCIEVNWVKVSWGKLE